MYEVYRHNTSNVANIHARHCRFLRQHGGISVRNPPAGVYYGPFDTLDKADAKALATGRRLVRRCSVCLDGQILRGD